MLALGSAEVSQMKSQMKRRDFLMLLGSSLIGNPVAAEAQQVMPSRIGFLRVGPPPPTYIGGFREGLQEQALIEGRDVVIEFALAQSAKRIPETAVQLARTQPGIIVAAGRPSVFPARDAAGAIPVVFVATFDPVATGLVSSLARPGGNVTGLTTISGDLVAKRLELIKEFFPAFTKVAILVRESSPTAPQYIQQSRFAAEKLGVELQVFSERQPSDLEKLLVAARASDALVVGDDTEFTTFRAKIAELAISNKVPTIHGLREMVDAGGLLSYGASFHDLYRRAASQVKKILQGVKPGDLPIEQPSKFELVVNVRTAEALGLKLSPMLLARADEVIE
jgi:putative tryptophan/tyrosine transport system substrate-binding protein